MLILFIPGTSTSRLIGGDGVRAWPLPFFSRLTRMTGKAVRRLEEPILKPDGVMTRLPVAALLSLPLYGRLWRWFGRNGALPEGGRHVLIPHAYDWRQDLVEVLAPHAAAALDRAWADRTVPEPVAILGHSMGGLIARILVESGRFESRPWYEHLRWVVTFGTPHRGAPAAASFLLGMAPYLGLPARAVAKLLAEPRFASTAQMLPWPDEKLVWRQDGRRLEGLGLDDYDLGLPGYAREARGRLLAALDPLRRPRGLSMLAVAGGGLLTQTGFRLSPEGRLRPRFEFGAGDRMVPLMSQLIPEAPARILRLNHAGLVRARIVFRMLEDLLPL